MSRYTAVTPEDLEAMLAVVGAASVDELFDQIPDSVRLREQLDLPAGMPEQDVYAHLLDLARRNTSAEDEITFLGAGMYDHYVPAVIDMLLGRSEFLTPYTPYQPEISQGGLQVMFEYQTAISELTGLPVSNASVYEGPSAVGAAGYLAKLANGKRRFVVSAGLHPHSRETLRTLSRGYGTEVVEVPLVDGVTDRDAWAAAIDDDTSAVFFQQPNALGAVEDAAALAAAAKDSPAVVVGSYDPLPLGDLGHARRVRRRRRRRRGPDARQPARLRRAVVRVLRRRRAAPAPHARPDRRRDERRRRAPRIRSHAADARAAHPPREGYVQHLHLAGPERACRRRLPELAGP